MGTKQQIITSVFYTQIFATYTPLKHSLFCSSN